MAEHTHQWTLELEEAYGGQFYCAAHCTICRLEMPIDETNRRLNAYDKLVAERDLLLRGLGINDPSRIAEILPASALEEK